MVRGGPPPSDDARPPDVESAAALPLDAPERVAAATEAAVRVTGEHEAPALVGDSIPRVVRRIALPAVASNLLMTLFGSVDAYWVGTRVGSEGLAAVSTSIFWVWMVISLAEMIGVGLTAVAARRHGERRPVDAAEAVGDALLFGLALGVAIAVAGTLLVDQLFAAMGTPPEVTALGRRYLSTYLVGTPLIYGFFAVDAAFRASGDTRTPLALLAASVAVTLVLDPVLILGLGPAPRLGIAGAAIATVSTRGAAFVMGLVLLQRRGLVRLRRGVPGAAIPTIARIGLPIALTGTLFSVVYVALTRTVAQFGTPALAALGLGHRIESWLDMTSVGFGAAAAAIVGQNLGAGRPDRASRAGWIATAYGTAPAVLFCAAEVLVPERFAALFTSDPAVIAETARYLRIAAVSQLVVCAEVVLEGALGGAGDTIPPMIASTTLTASRIPLAAWAARWGPAGIWWTISITAFARGVAMMAIWHAGRWRRRAM